MICMYMGLKNPVNAVSILLYVANKLIGTLK